MALGPRCASRSRPGGCGGSSLPGVQRLVCPMARPRSSNLSFASGSSGFSSPAIVLGNMASRSLRILWEYPLIVQMSLWHSLSPKLSQLDRGICPAFLVDRVR